MNMSDFRILTDGELDAVTGGARQTGGEVIVGPPAPTPIPMPYPTTDLPKPGDFL
jgi:hypothetical protein